MLKTFTKGGIHPPENKFSAGKKIIAIPLPKTVSIPISQHIGAPSQIIVNKGDDVKTGQLVAKSGGFVSANIHSSVSGKVKKIDNIIDSSGYKKSAIIIDVIDDIWDESIDKSKELITEIKLDPKQIIDKIAEKGIVGLGGATFPTQIKLMPPPGSKAKFLIINSVECEPYLTADHQLMLEKGNEIIIGINILMKALQVNKSIIGIENNKKDAINHLKKLTKDIDNINVQELKVKYPQGGEKQLIKALTGREVPSGALPISTGCVVQNVGTTFAVYEAVQKNKPLFERIVTVTGKSIKEPLNLQVRIGTPTSELIKFAGGLPEDTGKIVSGGPMMGRALSNIDVPITKGSSGVLIFKSDESSRKKILPCIRCAKCVSVCPMGLEPFLLMTLAEKNMFDEVEKEKALDCIECGSCSYICPSNRPLLDYIRLGKSTVNNIIRLRKTNG